MPTAILWTAVSSQRQASDDKISLSYQEETARAWCLLNNYTVIDHLQVHGHSRSETDIVTLLEDYRANGIRAYEDLRQHWMKKDFDLLVAYSTDRLGRSQTVITWIIENIIQSGAMIYLLADGGFMTKADYRFKIGIGGITVTSPLDHFRDKAKQAKDALVARGLPITSGSPASHIRLRDASGKDIGLIINPERYQMMQDLAKLLLRGVSWLHIGETLLREYGHGDSAGRPFGKTSLYEAVFNPATWGHSARFSSTLPSMHRYKLWVTGSAPAPEGAILHLNTVPPIYTGELADQLKAELMRRSQLRGKQSTARTYMFQNLCVCDGCHKIMGRRARVRKNGTPAIRCQHASPRDPRYIATFNCPNRKSTPDSVIQTYVDKLLTHYLVTVNDPSWSLPDELPMPTAPSYTAEIAKVQGQLEALIIEQSLAPQSARASYRTNIERLAEQLATLEHQQATQKAQNPHDSDTLEQRQSALSTIRKNGTLGAFWELPPLRINQLLLQFFGNYKLVLKGKIVIGLGLVSKKS